MVRYAGHARDMVVVEGQAGRGSGNLGHAVDQRGQGRRLEVGGRRGRNGLGAGGLGVGGEQAGFGNAVVADLDDDGNAAAGGRDKGLGGGHALFTGQRDAFAGAAAYVEAGDAITDEVFDHRLDHGEVQAAVGVEWGKGGGQQAIKPKTIAVLHGDDSSALSAGAADTLGELANAGGHFGARFG